jgi:hypothetical protein
MARRRVKAVPATPKPTQTPVVNAAAIVATLKNKGDKAKTKLQAQTKVVAKKVVAKAETAKATFSREVAQSKGISEVRKELTAIQQERYIAKLEGLVAKQAVEIADLRG